MPVRLRATAARRSDHGVVDWLGRVRPRALPRRAAAPVLAPRPRAQPRAGALAERLGVPCVATGNVHSHHPDRARLQDAFVAARLLSTLDQTEPQRRGNGSSAMASPAEMAARFPEHPDAVAETARLAERIEFDLTRDLGYRYPGSHDPDADRNLAELCRAKLAERYPGAARATRGGGPPGGGAARDPHARPVAASSCCTTTCSSWRARSRPRCAARAPCAALLPPGRGRGSSVSSIVCYLTGLSHIDPIRNRLLLGRFLHEEITSLPDIDLDFPRDIREKLIPRVHERYGTERAALVAAFATYRWKGVIRDLGKALGLPAGEIERVARSADVYGDVDDFRHGVEEAIGAAARGLGALAGADRAGPGGLRAAAPRLPAPRRDGDLDRAADRPLPGAALGDGGPQPRAVGQGLLRGRGLPEDRPARAGDAVGGRALRGRDRARARRADRPLAHPTTTTRRCTRRSSAPRRPACSRSRAARRCRSLRRTQPAHPGRPHGAGRARAAGADPGRRGAPIYRAARAPARGPGLQGALRAPAARAGAGRDARRDRVPGPGAGGGDGARRLHARRGRGAAARDEPQALRGGDPGAPRALHRGSDGARRRAARSPSGSSSRCAASRASASRRRTRRRSGCSPTSRPGCACTTGRSSCARC